MTDVGQPKQPFKGFTLICDQCSGDDIFLRDHRLISSEETGLYGDLDLVCRKCGAEVAVLL